jgi:hypothetical protein
MIPDPRWLDALKLPQKVIAGLFLFSLLLLAFDYFALVSLTDLSALARPVVIITALLFGSLSLTALVAVIHDIIAQRRKMTLLSKRRQIRREETDRAQAEFESQALARLNFLSKEEIRYIAEPLRKNQQSFTARVHSPHLSNLMAKGLVGSPGGTHHQDYYPFSFPDFVWAALQQRRDEFIAKDDEHKRREAAEKEAEIQRTLRRRY